MGDLLLLVGVANVVLIIASLFDCITSDDEHIRHLPKLLWILVILLFEGAGAIVWFLAGRPLVSPAPPGTGAGIGTHPAGRGRTEPDVEDTWMTGDTTRDVPRQIAPDDDPEFLRTLADQSRRADEERLRKWEADLHKREERLRDGDEPPTDQ